MVRIAPVRLAFNPKTLWFDAAGFELHVNDKVVVQTARGLEFGTVANAPFDMEKEDMGKLKSPLKPVKRLATDEDVVRSDELAEKGRAALPTFKSIAAETVPEMNPVAVEFMFDGDKAVFYFESEDRVDFRGLVKKLASEFHVRVDMKQIGVRDEARIVGGIGHCGQELCCRRLGGNFDPVSIRMAKEQDLSLNPQKISGLCGRLMCCLRYEYEAYKDFHSRAPKKNAKIETPDGEGKVVEMNVPREVISIKVGDEKPVRVPLADMEPPEEGARPTAVGEEAWQRANEPAGLVVESALNLFTNQLTGEDKLAEPGKMRHVHGEDQQPKKSRSRSRRRGGGRGQKAERPEEAKAQETQQARKPRRRRSTTVKSDGTAQTTEIQGGQQTRDGQQKQGGQQRQGKQAEASQDGARKSSSRRRSRSRSGSKQRAEATEQRQEAKTVQVGRNSSALRSGRQQQQPAEGGEAPKEKKSSNRRRRRRSHKSSSNNNAGTPAE